VPKSIFRLCALAFAASGIAATCDSPRLATTDATTTTRPQPRPAIGTARDLPDGWDRLWQQALIEWMAVENLEERAAAPGWIDPRVVEFIRRRSPAS